MGKIYKDGSDVVGPIVVVKILKEHWVVRSKDPHMRKDVKNFLQSVIPGMRYCGISDEERIIEQMEIHGFTRIIYRYDDDHDHDLVSVDMMIFEHTASITTRQG